MICPGIVSSKHIHHTFLTTEAILLQKNCRKGGLEEPAEILWISHLFHGANASTGPSWTEDLEQEDAPTQSNSLGKTTQLYFHLQLKKKWWPWKKGECTRTSMACPESQGGNLPNAHWNSAASSSASWIPQITGICAALQETGTKKFIGHGVFQFLPYLQVKPWSVSQLQTCPQGFSCGKCRASSSCGFIRVAHTQNVLPSQSNRGL